MTFRGEWGRGVGRSREGAPTVTLSQKHVETSLLSSDLLVCVCVLLLPTRQKTVGVCVWTLFLPRHGQKTPRVFFGRHTVKGLSPSLAGLGGGEGSETRQRVGEEEAI